MEFRLLGPVGLWTGAGEVDLGPPRQRCVLAALLLQRGQPLATDSLIERVWDLHPPARARDVLYTYLARLRRALHATPQVRLGRSSSGYLLEVPPANVDAHRFADLIGSAADGREVRIARLREALGLWRGEPLENLTGDWVDRVRESLRRQRLGALVACHDLELARGAHATVIGELTDLVTSYPTAEPLVAQLMLALYRQGRQAEALRLYRDTRRQLVDEQGIEPGPALRQLEHAILTNDPGLDLVEQAPETAVRIAPPHPAQLPLDVPGFTGRHRELNLLEDSGAMISVISGTAGVGKTALAVHWAHRVALRFPDGQLYVNLRGFDPDRPPLTPLETLSMFLRALGVDPGAIPQDRDEAAALYRSRLAGRRVLVVLDNAGDAEQVRPLLPGSATCSAVVTSRNSLSALVAHAGARVLALDVLTADEACQLLQTVLSRPDADGDPGAVAALARICAYLPLALRIAAADLICNPQLTVAGYAADLGADDPLAVLGREHLLDSPDIGPVSAAFSLSYSALPPPARILFRLLSVVPGADFDLRTAAVLIGSTCEAARPSLHRLRAAHLVAEVRPGRYAMHDLLRRYSRARASADDSPAGRDEAERRLVDFYTQTTHEAYPLLSPRRGPAPRLLEYPPVEPLLFTTRDEAMTWLDHERENIIGAVLLAARRGWHVPAWQLADSLFAYLHQRRRWSEWLVAVSAGVRSAELAGDLAAQGRLHNSLGVVYKQLGLSQQAREHYTTAYERAESVGDTRLMLALHVNLGGLCLQEGEFSRAVAHLRAAVADPRHGHEPRFATLSYLNLGVALLEIGEDAEAKQASNEALRHALNAGDLLNLCHVYHNLAELGLREGDVESAHRHADEQVRLATTLGDPLRRAAAQDMLASCLAPNDPQAARERWLAAYEIYRDLDHAMAKDLAAWLERIEGLADLTALAAQDAARRATARRLL